MDKLQATDKFAARLLMIGFFLPMKLQAAVIILACVYFVCRAFADKRPVLLRNVLRAFALGSIFLLYAGAILLTPQADRHWLMILVGNRMALLLMPVFLAMIMPSFGNTLVRELKFFVYACIVACIIANAAFVYHYYLSGQVITPLSHVAYRQFLERFTGLHPTYMSMYLAFAVCILLAGYVPLGRVMKFGMLYVLLIFVLAILAKSPLIALAVIFIHSAYVHRNDLARYKVPLALLFIAVAAGCIFIPFIGQRMGELFSFAGSKAPTNVIDNSMYVRKLIWEVDTDLLKKYWLTGVGPARLLRLLDYRYFFYSISHNNNIGYFDPHNEYFWEWLSFGIIGIIVSIGVLVMHLAKAIKSRNYLYLYLLIILLITFSTESVLSRQQGILFYAVFTSLFYFYKPERTA